MPASDPHSPLSDQPASARYVRRQWGATAGQERAPADHQTLADIAGLAVDRLVVCAEDLFLCRNAITRDCLGTDAIHGKGRQQYEDVCIVEYLSGISSPYPGRENRYHQPTHTLPYKPTPIPTFPLKGEGEKLRFSWPTLTRASFSSYSH
jgi:hypothetical protein